MEALVLRCVAQLAFSALHGTYGTEHIFVHLAGVADAAVLAVMGHVVAVKGQQNQVVSAVHVQVTDDRVIELVQQGGVLPLTLAQGGEQPVLVAVQHLPGGKGNVQQVFPQRAGKAFLQQRKVFFLFLGRQQTERFVQGGDDLAGSVHIEAVEMGDAVVLGPDAAADLPQLLLIHMFKILSQNCMGHYGTKRDFCPARKGREFPTERGESFRHETFSFRRLRTEARRDVLRPEKAKGKESAENRSNPQKTNGKLLKEWMKLSARFRAAQVEIRAILW